ncbi:hypothetical protein [Algoriphagus sp.]|uniref:hypothetical protein n=1 Tax=Algoriphagus sp. TaxID=1872435 RepID=UPI00271A891B|nr:hypothetical protein [Algoriphagus sp.]MDO8967331.1 hypothetical protein [Algoriphagus sp.]MDP3200613.1 hypothetical protein [Algoriphagus sp.]
MNLLLTSCVEEPEAPKIEVIENAQIAQVKSWFEENKTKLRLPERGSNFRSESQELILPFFEEEPDWDKFHHYYFPDGREVFEINLENEQVYIPKPESKDVEEEFEERVIQNILFVKHRTENRFDPLIVRYYPDEETSKRDFKAINYQMIDEKWSGWIDLFTYDEHYFIGFQIEKGQITNTRKFNKNAPNGKFYIGKENMDVRCKIVETVWINVTIAGDVMTITSLESTLSQFCTVGGNDSYTSGGGSYSYGGDSYSSNGGYSGSYSGYNPPDVPMPKLTIYIDSSFSQNKTLKCAQEMLEMSKFVYSLAEFTNKTSPKNVTFKVGTTIQSGAGAETDGTTYGHNNIIITFNEKKVNDMSSLDAARVILHEIIHAEIYNAVGEKRGSLLVGNFQNNFEEYKKLYPNNNSLQQHNFMAEYIVDNIAKVLQEIHPLLGASEFYNAVGGTSKWPKGINPTFYTAMAWHGLNSSKEWNEMKYEDRKVLQDLQDLDNRLTKTCIQ